MITKEYLQQELAKRIDGYKRGVETTTDNIIAEMKSILVLVDALEKSEHLADARKTSPNDLEEAAGNHIRNVVDTAGHPGWDWTTQDIAEAFIAGSKWQKERMMKEAVEKDVHELYTDEEGYHCYVSLGTDYMPGDKVRIIIVK